ncbi:hypothetical protein JW933_08835 [candidate division FCPU426 bacterium]|nr:hypothetical protein [candidate division FCPU426 bacterium]
MELLDWFDQYPLEALPYEIGFILLAASMIWYAIVLKKMVAIIHEKPIWILPLAGALCILASVAMHSIAYVFLLPRMDILESVDEITRFSAFMLQWRAWSLTGILAGGALSLIGGGFYYRWTTR